MGCSQAAIVYLHLGHRHPKLFDGHLSQDEVGEVSGATS